MAPKTALKLKPSAAEDNFHKLTVAESRRGVPTFIRDLERRL